ncbi:MAG TPA: GIY-YIG nuclease family protein [Terracidiphilus sp.]|nr:GIY-YIG nuclease family protein [Terracidiphilus sp.]
MRRVTGKGGLRWRDFPRGAMMPEDEFDFEDESPREAPVLIKAYGEYWNPDLVAWDSKKLLGRTRKAKGREIDVYGQIGVYVLYKDFQPVYVGRSVRQSIGNRIGGHRLSKRKGPRWDTFSWFGIIEISLASGKLKRRRKSRFSATSEELIATLEALLIRTIDPKLNSRRERLKNAVRLSQCEPAETTDLEERMETIEKKIDRLLQRRGSK